MSDLTPAQWELYNLLKQRYDDEKYISKKEICEALPNYYQIKENETRTCRDIEFDVRAINDSDIIQKIIVSNSKGYKIGTKEQVADYLTGRKVEATKSLCLTYKLIHKAELNNQCKIAFGKGEREYIESYIKSMKNKGKEVNTNEQN